jgi:predicted porin
LEIENNLFIKRNAVLLGVKGTYLLNDRLTAIGFIETRKAAPTGWGIGAGIGLGYLFKLRENDTQDNPN